jgi:RNA-directed DNA polymerase
MSHTIKNCFINNLTFDKMIEAHERAKKGKMSRYEVLNFEFNLECNIVNLIERIKNNKYKIGKYRSFTIYEPKERLIKALPYEDRVVHQWYVEEFIKKYIVPKFIKDTYACIKGRGTHKAVDILQKYMRKAKVNYGDNYYILKMDINKFFYSIDHDILFKIMSDFIRDKKLLNFTKLLIYSEENLIGIPIGNYTSQFFANIYLHKLDMFVKNNLKIKYYVRYMDDFVLLLKDKQMAKEVFVQIQLFLKNELKLLLNEKSRYYPCSFGANFCGYRIWTTHRLVRNRSKKNIKKKIVIWNKLYQDKKLDRKDFVLSFNSWLGHIKHSNSYNLKKEIQNKIVFYN